MGSRKPHQPVPWQRPNRLGKNRAGGPPVPLINITDLYHLYQDVGDNFDLIMHYALPEPGSNGYWWVLRLYPPAVRTHCGLSACVAAIGGVLPRVARLAWFPLRPDFGTWFPRLSDEALSSFVSKSP